MGLFGSKDWNIIAITYERDELYRVNGNRSKGGMATKTREGAKNHGRTIYWAVFDQKGKFLEGDPGPGMHLVEPEALQKLMREIVTNKTVLDVLNILEQGEKDKVAKNLLWGGYPKTDS